LRIEPKDQDWQRANIVGELREYQPTGDPDIDRQ
jgi:hypothetical protein